MIRIRHKDGRVAQTPDDAFVEITDDKGCLAMVIVTNATGVRCATAGDPLFNAHLRLHRMTPSRVIVHEPLPQLKP